jgi:hypothetical protein
MGCGFSEGKKLTPENSLKLLNIETGSGQKQRDTNYTNFHEFSCQVRIGQICSEWLRIPLDGDRDRSPLTKKDVCLGSDNFG